METTEQVQKLNELVALATEHKTFVGKLKEEIQTVGTSSAETKTALEVISGRLDKVQIQADAIDAKLTESRFRAATEPEEKSMGEQLTTSEEFVEAQKHGFPGKKGVSRVYLKGGAFGGRAPFRMEAKTITAGGLGAGTSGITMPERIDGPLGLARIGLRIRDLLNIRTMTTGNAFDWIRQTTRTNAASPQQEAAAKAESTYSYDTQSGVIRTIAHFVKLSRQALDDIPFLRGEIDSELLYGLLLKEEAEILAGSGVGEHLNGIQTQATAYDTGTYNVSGDTTLDKLRHMKLQARLAGLATFAPDAFVLHPRDIHNIELIKTEEGAANKGVYVVGDPKTGQRLLTIWGLPVVESDSITYGQGLVGAFGTAATLVDRMQASLEISFENEDDFIKNKATILCEERIGLAVKRPTAFISGTITA